jgi:hypothetical protein
LRDILARLNGKPNDLRTWYDRLAILLAQNDRNGLTAAVSQLPPDADHDGNCWKYRGFARVHRRESKEAADAIEQSLEDSFVAICRRLIDRGDVGRD